MRKLAAHYIYPITSEPIKYGIITLDDDGVIVDISSSHDNLPEQESLEFYNGILVPGFVNAHCHLELSHMKGILPEGGGMGAFCDGITQSRNHVSFEQQQQMAKDVDMQMYNEGVVAVGDISNGESSFDVKQQSQIFYHTFVECLGFDNDKADSIIQRALQVKKAAATRHLSASIAPHAPYSMSEKLYAESIRLGQANGILSIHNQESSDEMELFRTGTSHLREVFQPFGFDDEITKYKNPINRLLKYIDSVSSVLLIHNVYTSAEDVERVNIANPHTTWVLCPNSNLYIENTLPPIEMLQNKALNIAIGTDSLSSNKNLSILDELKTISTIFHRVSLQSLLYWATMGGAKALKKDGVFGSFDIGKRPGVVQISNIDFDNVKLTENSTANRVL